MRVLVTGGSGLLGSRLARLLCEEGAEVRATYRPGDRTDLLEGLPVQAIPCDLLDGDGTRRAVRGVEAVLHAAALVSFDPGLYELQMRVNVEGTRLLLEEARRAGVGRLVHTSTVNTLGIPPPGKLGDEGTPFDWARYRLGYMDSKKASEDLVLACPGPECVAVLPGTFFGPGDIHANAGQYILQVARGVAVAAPPGGTSVVHVDDVATGHLLALRRGRPGGRYILAGENLSYRELFALIASEVGRRGPLLTLPGPFLVGAGRLADRLAALRVPRIPFGEGLAVAASGRLFYSSARACRELGYSFRPARVAIRDAVEWYRERGMIT